MNANELLDVIGGARDRYVMEAAATRKDPAKGRPGFRKPMLVAAMIALTLLLVGCAAVYVLHLQDMRAGERTFTQTRSEYGSRSEPTEIAMEVYTPHALKDTPIQKATVEWTDFLNQYDPDHPSVKEEEIPQKFKLTIPANYMDTYECRTPEMAMKLDEIAAKYSLKLLDVELLAQRWQRDVMNEVLGITGMTRADAEVKAQEGVGFFFPNGNFTSDLSFTLWNEDVAWTEECFAEFHYAKKDTFTPQLSFITEDHYEQWNYTSADGTPLLLVLEDSGKGQIYADVGDATIFIALNPWTSFGDGEKPTREAIEQMADVFDYHISPQPFDPVEAQRRLDVADAEYQSKLGSTECKSYAEFLNQMDWVERYSYALLDLNGDGVDELLLDDGYVCNFYTIEEGDVKEKGGTSAPYALCQGGYITSDMKDEYLGGNYSYFSVSQYVGGDRVFKNVEQIVRNAQGTLEHIVGSGCEGTPISEEEAQSIQDNYIPLDISFIPTRDFPMDESGTTLGDLMAAESRPSEEEILRQYAEFANGDSWMLHDSRYFALRDLNGDGIDDLLLGDDTESFRIIMTMYRGRIATLRYMPTYYLCEGNVLNIFNRYDNEAGDWLESHQFIRLYDGNHGKDLGYVSHNTTSDTWTDGDGSQITADEAQTLISKYPRIDPGMKPIGELGK